MHPNKTTMLRHSLVAFLASLLLIAGCGGGDDTRSPSSYDEAKWRWTAEGSRSYHFTLTRSCFCLPESPIVVTVRDGRVIGGRFSDTGSPVDASRAATLPTFSDLFALVDRAYAQNAAVIRVTTNAEHGYLESVFIDYSASIADEEVSYTVSNYVLDSF
jgi:hypothetical protein